MVCKEFRTKIKPAWSVFLLSSCPGLIINVGDKMLLPEENSLSA